MAYTFQTSAYDVEQLVPETSVALEKRVELASRRRLPGMWKATDSLTQKGEAQQMTRSRLVYRRGVGIALIVLGLFMLIPGLKEPEELLLPLIAGVCGIAIGIHSLWGTRKKPEKEAVEALAQMPEKKISKRFEGTARTFLSNIAKVGQTEVRFSEDGMQLGESALISYQGIEYFIETPQGYLVAWGTQATFLQKKDLQGATEDEFYAFVSERVSGV